MQPQNWPLGLDSPCAARPCLRPTTYSIYVTFRVMMMCTDAPCLVQGEGLFSSALRYHRYCFFRCPVCLSSIIALLQASVITSVHTDLHLSYPPNNTPINQSINQPIITANMIIIISTIIKRFTHQNTYSPPSPTPSTDSLYHSHNKPSRPPSRTNPHSQEYTHCCTLA